MEGLESYIVADTFYQVELDKISWHSKKFYFYARNVGGNFLSTSKIVPNQYTWTLYNNLKNFIALFLLLFTIFHSYSNAIEVSYEIYAEIVDCER